MEELSNITYEAINRYFTVLESTGYINDADVNKLLLLQFIQEFLIKYQGYITEDDYRIISTVLSCLSGSSCLIPYKQFTIQIALPKEDYVECMAVKVSEADDIRRTEPDFGLRLVNL